MKVTAKWNGRIIAESDETIVLEGNHYFPADSLHEGYFDKTDTKTHCPFKGDASYFSILVEGKENKDAAWYYPSVKEGYEKIKGRVAFWRGVEVRTEN